MKYHPGLTLDGVFRQALAVAGPDRLLFGTDSSFFPRGWQRPVYDAQRAALDAIGVSAARSREDPRRQLREALPECAENASSPCLSRRGADRSCGVRRASNRPLTRDARADERQGRDRRDEPGRSAGDRHRRRSHRRSRQRRRRSSATSDRHGGHRRGRPARRSPASSRATATSPASARRSSSST